MTVEAEVSHNDSRRQAWEKYKQTDEYANIRRWALHEEHVDGSLWAAFLQGCESIRAELAAEREKNALLSASLRQAEAELVAEHRARERAENSSADIQTAVPDPYRSALDQIRGMELPYAPSGISSRAQWYLAATSWRLTAEQMQEIAGNALEVSDDGE